MECDFLSHTIHEDFHQRASRLLEKEHHATSVQLKKYSKKCNLQRRWRLLDDGFRKYSKTCDYSAAKSSGAYQTRGHGIPDVARFSTQYEMGPVPYPFGM